MASWWGGERACGGVLVSPMIYYVTFGQQYPREPHPTFAKAHRDGWVEIEAPDEITARRIAVGWFDRAWAFIYSESDPWRPKLDMYPLGCLHRITLGDL